MSEEVIITESQRSKLIATQKHRRTARYSQGTLQKALDEVKNGEKTIFAASKEYNIPKDTIRTRHLGICHGYKGASTNLCAEHERLLVEWVIKSAEYGCPKTKQEIIAAAGELASLEPNSQFKGGLPSSGWFKCFVNRHRELSKRTPQALGKASADVTYEKLKFAFELIWKQFNEEDILYLLEKPSQWFNVDETNFLMNPMPMKVYAQKGAKTVHNTERGKTKENITVTCAVSADGHAIPPLVTFKESFSGIEAAAVIAKTIGADFGFNQTASGWMKGDAFFDYVTQHLNPYWLKMETERPIVLVVDGYSAHHSLKLFQWCLENEVKLFVLPPNTTHLTQVLDVAVFGPLKSKYLQHYQQWKTLNPSESFNEFEFIKLLKLSFDAVLLKQDNIIRGWRATGLQPFDFTNIDPRKLLRSDITTTEAPLIEVLENKLVDFPLDDYGFPFCDENQDLNVFPYRNGVTEAPKTSTSSNKVEDCENLSDDDGFQLVSMMSFNDDNVSVTEDDEVHEENHENLSPNVPQLSLYTERAIKKLVNKSRQTILQLKSLLQVHDPSKQLNILIMEQQLNIIDPVICDLESPKPRTPEDTLKFPVKKVPLARRGFKLKFGLMPS